MIMPRLVNPWRGAGAIHFSKHLPYPPGKGVFFCFPYQPHQVYGPLYGHVVMSDFGLVPGEFGAGTDGCLYEHHAANVVDTSQSGDQAPRGSPSDTRKVWEDGKIPNSAASDRKQTKDWCWGLILLMDNIQANQLSINNIPVLSVDSIGIRKKCPKDP